MSTKIYTAYKFDAKLHDLIQPLLGYRDRVLIQARHGLRSIIAADAKVTETADAVKKTILSGVNDPLNFQCSMVLLCHRRISGTIMIPFGVEYIERITKKKVPLPKGARDWCYYNNSDRPEKVSDAEWKQREREYDLLAKQGGTTFSEMGFTMPIIEYDSAWRFAFDALMENRQPKVENL